MENKLIPHKTVIMVKAVVYELLPTGECSGIPIEKTEYTFAVDGRDKLSCLDSKNKILEDIKNVTRNK